MYIYNWIYCLNVSFNYTDSTAASRVIQEKWCSLATGVMIDYTDRQTDRAIDHIHAAAMMNKKRGLAGRFTANLRVST